MSNSEYEVQNQAEVHEIFLNLSIVMTRVDNLARLEAHAGTPFNIHKALNILYKELNAARVLLGEMSHMGLKTTPDMREVQEPQSWKVYNAGKSKLKKGS
jgi:hypothetical protein